MTTLEDARTPAPARLRKRFAERFGNAGARPLAFASAPGRVELAGNHTDHQGGCTISAAIDRRIYALAAPNGTDEMRVSMELQHRAELRRLGRARKRARDVACARARHGGRLRARGRKAFRVRCGHLLRHPRRRRGSRRRPRSGCWSACCCACCAARRAPCRATPWRWRWRALRSSRPTSGSPAACRTSWPARRAARRPSTSRATCRASSPSPSTGRRAAMRSAWWTADATTPSTRTSTRPFPPTCAAVARRFDASGWKTFPTPSSSPGWPTCARTWATVRPCARSITSRRRGALPRRQRALESGDIEGFLEACGQSGRVVGAVPAERVAARQRRAHGSRP